jgi:hypothetical protein
MVGIGRCLLELDNHVYRAAMLAAFQSIEVIGHPALLTIGKGQSGSEQGN